MRELNDTEKQQLEQHTRWLTGNGEEGALLVWSSANLHGANLSSANLNGYLPKEIMDEFIAEARAEEA